MPANRIRSLVAAALLVPALGLVTAQPAGASVVRWDCYANVKDFSLPGKPDVSVTAKTCIYRYDNRDVRAKVQVTWGTWASYIGGKRFHNFDAQARIEEYGGDYTSRVWCDFTNEINSQLEGTATCWTGRLLVPSWSDKKYTGDGKVFYDIANDGDGSKTWELYGTHPV